jgi:hypothetical protein
MRLANLPDELQRTVARLLSPVDAARIERLAPTSRIGAALAAQAYKKFEVAAAACRTSLRRVSDAKPPGSVALDAATRACAARLARIGGLNLVLQNARERARAGPETMLRSRPLDFSLQLAPAPAPERDAMLLPAESAWISVRLDTGGWNGREQTVVASAYRDPVTPTLDRFVNLFIGPDRHLAQAHYTGDGLVLVHATPAGQDALVWALLAALGDHVVVRFWPSAPPDAAVSALMLAVRGAAGGGARLEAEAGRNIVWLDATEPTGATDFSRLRI